jgi:hypothetical protein
MTRIRAVACSALFAFTALGQEQAASSDEAVANEIATMFRAARKVISEQQDLINDASKGDKGLSPEKVVATMRTNYAAATRHDYQDAPAGSLLADVQKAFSSAIGNVMTKAQPLINEQGKGSKGFLPAVFAKQIADEINKQLDGRVFVKLTAPKAFLRNRANRPDEWEEGVIEKKFKAKDWQKGQAFVERGAHKGREGLRLMIPEYYSASCLQCHGEPKGSPDISGGKKEGGKLDDLGGAISVVVYGVAAAAPGK